MDNDAFRAFGHQLIDWAADYRSGLHHRPVGHGATPGAIKAALPAAGPERGEDFAQVLADLDRHIVPNLVHWQHPAYFGWFPTGGLEAGVLGDVVSSVLSVVGLSWESSPALTELEEVVVDWVRQWCGLPAQFEGVIQDSASTSTLVALLCAREKATGFSLLHGGMAAEGQGLVVYYSPHSHSSVEKAAQLAGFGRDNLRQVACTDDDAMCPAALQAQIAADRAAGLCPCAIVASSGTTSVLAFDNLTGIAQVAEANALWLHVDAAMAGAAMLLPEMRHLFDGIERADSIVINAHKWLGVPFDCSLYYLRDAHLLQKVMSTNPAYLQSSQDEVVRNYRDWGLPLGRRFRALKLWFVLREQGLLALQARLRRDIGNAQWLGGEVERVPEWRLVRPVRLQTVCVRHEPATIAEAEWDRHNRDWAERINASGAAWVSPSTVDGKWMVRISIGAHATERADVERAWQAMQDEAARLVSG